MASRDPRNVELIGRSVCCNWFDARTSSASVNRTSSLDLLVRVERGAAPLRAQVEEQLRDAVRSGRLAPGIALPSSRSLARELGVSRGVVVDAYAQLAAEGYLVATQGAPTRVSEAAIPAALAARPPRRRPAAALRLPPGRARRVAVPARGLARRRCGARCATRRTRGSTTATRAAPPSCACALARYLGRARGVARRPRADRGHLRHGPGHGAVRPRAGRPRRAAHRDGGPVEHARAASSWSPTASRSLPVPVDADGLSVDRLEQLAPSAVFTAPAHQFPLGVVLAPERRTALIDWAARTDAFVLEDDYDAEYRYDRPPVGAVQGLAPDRVLYAGSVSKTLAPGLRLGWMVVPERLADGVVERQGLGRPRHAGRRAARARGLPRARRARPPPAPHALGLPRAPRRAGRGARARAAGLPARRGRRRAAPRRPAPRRSRRAGRAGARRARAGVGLYGLSEHRIEPGPPALLLGYGRIAEPAIGAAVAELAAAVRYAA